MSVKKLIFGVGINDADYNVYKYETVNGKTLRVWICPFYQKWKDMLQRCYSEKFQKYRPTYVGCYTTPEWHYFMTFRSWMEKQDWEGKQLDKDLLFRGNKVYGPDTCVFVESRVNLFLGECTASRGEWPIGVTFHKVTGKYQSQCLDFTTGKKKHLGLFDNPEKAYEVWLSFKLEQAYILAAEQTDPRIAKALIERYKNYGKLD